MLPLRPLPVGLWLVLGVTMVACADAPVPVATPARMPIVLISMDTLRADRVGAYGNPNGLTPNLDKFAAEAVVFDHAYSQATQTAPSHASVFTSRYPSEQAGIDYQPILMREHPTLASVLSLYDYQTGAYVAGGDLSSHRNLMQGFASYGSGPDFGSLHHTTPLATAWLDGLDRSRPWFLFLHGYDCHARYLKPTPFGYLHADLAYKGVGQELARTATERLIDGMVYKEFAGMLRAHTTVLRPRSEDGRAQLAEIIGEHDKPVPVEQADLDVIRGAYDGAVAYADAMFGIAMADLEARGVLDQALIVVFSDHGEQLGERGLFGHCCGAEEEETRVVLMARMPRGDRGGRHVDGLVELVDVMPTLVELAGGTIPARVRGRSLAAAIRGEPFEGRPYAHTEGNQLTRLVTVRGPAGRLSYTGLYTVAALLPDMLSTASLTGPGFTTSVGLPESEREPMRQELLTWLASLDPPPSRRSAPLPESLKKSLREHGYFDVQP